MRRKFLLVCAALGGTLLFLMGVRGMANVMPAPTPVPQAAEVADAIVLGKVSSIENQDVMAAPYPGAPNKIPLRIAAVKIETGLKGAKGLTHVRVAFDVPPPPMPPPPPPKPGQPVRVERPAFRPVELKVGDEGCFVLRKQPDDTFFRMIDSKYVAKTDAAKIAQFKKCVGLLDDLPGALKAKDASDRLTAAYMLLCRYGLHGGPKPKSEPIAAAESKLILEAIAGGDWAQPFSFEQLSPQQVFNFLHLTAKDGWTAPKQQANQDFRLFQQEWNAAAQKWLKDHASTYRVQRLVPEAPAK